MNNYTFHVTGKGRPYPFFLEFNRSENQHDPPLFIFIDRILSYRTFFYFMTMYSAIVSVNTLP